MMKNITLTLIFACCIATLAFGQIRTPRPSPGATVTQKVGLSDIEVAYSRPGVKGRTIFGADGLVPNGKFWRTGANAATKVTFSDPVTIGGDSLAKGSYAILTKPSANSWEFHFFPYESGSWSSYLDKKAAAIVRANTAKAADMVESFTISVDNVSMDAADLVFAWAHTKVALPVKVEVESVVMKNIDRVMAGPSQNDYFQAAAFMHDSGKDLNKALEYVQKATSMPNARFFHLRRESLILADLGRKKEAIAVAKKSLKLSKEAKNDDYVRLNEKSIAEWSK